MSLMAEYDDNHFDLAIVDPPYGIGMAEMNGGYSGKSPHKKKQWDRTSPSLEYFAELRRVSNNQIIWGANHMTEKIMSNSPCWIVWDKRPMPPSFASCELAYTSFKKNAATWSGKTGHEVATQDRIHPTQKPVALYKWLLDKYAEAGQTILDTHLGSGSIAIACHYAGHHLTACELDEDYFKAACDRIKKETSQTEFAWS